MTYPNYLIRRINKHKFHTFIHFIIIVPMHSPFTIVSDYLESKEIDRVVPLVGCAAHRLNLGVKSYYEDPKDPNSPKGLYCDHIKSINKLMVERIDVVEKSSFRCGF